MKLLGPLQTQPSVCDAVGSVPTSGDHQNLDLSAAVSGHYGCDENLLLLFSLSKPNLELYLTPFLSTRKNPVC